MLISNKSLGFIGSLYGFVGVALGAFGTHKLKNEIEPRLLETWNTAVFYILIHALVIILLVQNNAISRWRSISVHLFSLGSLCFSGSLFLYVLTNFKYLVFVTPLGGIILLAGWLSLMISFVKTK